MKLKLKAVMNRLVASPGTGPADIAVAERLVLAIYAAGIERGRSLALDAVATVANSHSQVTTILCAPTPAVTLDDEIEVP